jgi:translation initiation factor IF-3
MAKNKKSIIVEPRINYEIKGQSEVRLIYKENKDSVSENDFNKVVSWKEAVSLAHKKNLDLIEINSKSVPIIVRLDNYSKYLYDLKKQLKQKNKKTNTLKEIQLTVNISLHDLEIKVKKAKNFLEEGDKVKVVLNIRGRELTRREESKKMFYKFIEMMIDSGIASFDTIPQDEEKKSFVIFKKK